ncbi:MAG TPA: Hsp20/alpha crystallin family protein [Anaerolineales bacterium]|nr:Hsp20/alpha crystallin family protein [Anaerolineales bacterium]
MSWIVRYPPRYQMRRVRVPFESTCENRRALAENHPWAERRWPVNNLAIDLYETGSEIVVKAAIPGLNAEEVEIEEKEGVLFIRAESQRESESQEGGWHIRERHCGAWQRAVSLPAPVKGDQAEAELKDGVLTIRLPKTDPAKPANRIQVNLPKISLPSLGKREKKVKVKTE